MIWIIIGVCIIIVPLIFIVFCVAPGRIPFEMTKTVRAFYGLNCAHRGLFTKDQSVPENSIAAFIRARERGYGVELDIRLSKDDEVIVFHDNTLIRACGVDADVSDFPYKELSKLHLFGTDEKIPLFSEVLEVLDDTPVVVELKSSKEKNAVLCQRAYEILRKHGKVYSIESFDPRICAWFKKNAPHILRGQLSGMLKGDGGLSRVLSFILQNLLANFVSRPHYVAYSTEPFPLIARICMLMRPMKVVWTVTSGHDAQCFERDNDTIIFEHYTPAPRFK